MEDGLSCTDDHLEHIIRQDVDTQASVRITLDVSEAVTFVRGKWSCKLQHRIYDRVDCISRAPKRKGS